MSYINAIIFFFIIWLSQFATSIERSVSYEQHIQLQTELGEFIQTYVTQNIPTATNFKMHSLYTKPPKKGKLRAYFDYSFVESNTQTTTELKGFAVLKKIEDKPVQKWSLDSVEISGEKINFSEPIVIGPDTTKKE